MPYNKPGHNLLKHKYITNLALNFWPSHMVLIEFVEESYTS